MFFFFLEKELYLLVSGRECTKMAHEYSNINGHGAVNEDFELAARLYA